jgi:isochorismate synthase
MMDTAIAPAHDDAGDARAFLDRALARRRAGADGRAGLFAIAVPAPCADPLGFWRAASHERTWLWQAPSAEPVFAAAGIAAQVQGIGAERFAQVLCGLGRHPVEVHIRHGACVDAPAPRWFGGFAFRPGAADEPMWSCFGDAHFVLPRWTYAQRGNRAWLWLTTRLRADSCAYKVFDEYEAIVHALRGQAETVGEAHWSIERHEQSPRDQWVHLVQDAKRRIQCGLMRKVVLARRSTVTADREIDPARVLSALRLAHPHATIFGARARGRAFVGATPELLVRLRGRQVHSEALAGTCPAGAALCRETLLASPKDRHEQALVTEEILARLSPKCARIRAAAEPLAHRAGSLLHLRTAIEGELRDEAHVLELVEQLHPTPAVGGLPSTEALRWLAEHEPSPRGWYGAPVGWVDSCGDGEFVVALRSGLLADRSAWLYAGAGIVSGSDPDAEFEETGWKLRVMAHAVGATGEERAP